MTEPASAPWLTPPRLRSAEDLQRAAALISAVLERQITVEQGEKVLAVMFHGRQP